MRPTVSPLVPLYEIVNRDVSAERWRQHKTWRTQHQTDTQWDEGLAHYLTRLKRAETPLYRRQELVKLITFGLAAVEDLDSRGQQPAAVHQPPLDYDPEGSLR